MKTVKFEELKPGMIIAPLWHTSHPALDAEEDCEMLQRFLNNEN